MSENLKCCIESCLSIGSLPSAYGNTGGIPSTYLESLSYEEQLLWFCKFLKETVIPKLNDTDSRVKKLEDWFKDLDVQEEINNKLDEMAESGELVEIISAYLETFSVLGFDTKATMKSAENLINGGFAKTLGDLSYNDGKGNFYKIRTKVEGEIIDETNVIALTNYPLLVAELIPNYYLNQLTNKINKIENINLNYNILVDINGNGDYTSLSTAVSNANNNDIIYIKKGTYNNEIVNCGNKFLTIIGEDRDNTIIQNSYDDYTKQPLTISKGLIKNLSFKQNGSDVTTSIKSYAVHIDSDNSYNSKLLFENCYFYSLTHASVGIGLRPNFTLEFNNCTFRSDHNLTPQNEHRGALFVHNSNNPNMIGNNQLLILNNCKLSTQYGSVIHLEHCYNLSNNKAELICYNSDIFSDQLEAGNGLITQEKNETAANYSIVLSNKNGGNNYETLNNSKYIF